MFLLYLTAPGKKVMHNQREWDIIKRTSSNNIKPVFYYPMNNLFELASGFKCYFNSALLPPLVKEG